MNRFGFGRYQNFGNLFGSGREFTSSVTYVLIVVNLLIYVASLISSQVVTFGAYVPILGSSEPWRFLTSAFIHSGVLHLLFNMLSLLLVGVSLEHYFGKWKFLAIYLLGAIGSSVGYLLLIFPSMGYYSQFAASPYAVVVGASGAIFALFGAALVANQQVKENLGPLFVLLLINFSYGFLETGICWQGHVAGFVTGLAAAWGANYFSRKARFRGTDFSYGYFVVLFLVLVGLAWFKQQALFLA